MNYKNALFIERAFEEAIKCALIGAIFVFISSGFNIYAWNAWISTKISTLLPPTNKVGFRLFDQRIILHEANCPLLALPLIVIA